MNKQDRILHLATLTGFYLLESGGETYRVEDTICRILQNYGMKEVSAFTSPTVIISSCMDDERSYSKVLRVNRSKANLQRIDLLNQLSRDSDKLSIDEFEARLQHIIQQPTYPAWIEIACAGIIALGFTLFFNGIVLDALAAFVIGCFVQALHGFINKKALNPFVGVAITSFVITFFALLGYKYHLVVDYNLVIIGTIMLLVPGLAITNAIKDFLSGDLVSGTTRGFEAFLIAIFVALGSGMALTIWLRLGGRL
ncbi:MAG: threonine/serine exporter family protein [Erysipelotrichaceae bacterium]|nr:threonine/serine exporter family protein [Erysipelotrichaceae bacterium]